MWDYLFNQLASLLKTILIIVAIILAVGIPLSIIRRRRLKRLARERAGLSICEFARSFNYRGVGTKIIRAVYEGLQDWIKDEFKNFPVTAADDLIKVYGIDNENLDEFAEEIASKTNRRWSSFKDNPFYGKVDTVGNLVLFLSYQPKDSS